MPELPEPDAAFQHLFDNVHQQVFFHGLAQRGYVPQTEKQAQDLLELAGQLRMVDEGPVKEADDNLFTEAKTALAQVLGDQGWDQGLQAAQAEEEILAIKQAAAELAEDPDIYNSVLALKAAEADHYAALLQDQQPQN